MANHADGHMVLTGDEGTRPDPAASYRRFTPRQRARAAAKFGREAAAVRETVEAERTKAAVAKNLARSRETLRAAEAVLRQGVLRGVALTREERRTVGAIARDARKGIERITGEVG